MTRATKCRHVHLLFALSSTFGKRGKSFLWKKIKNKRSICITSCDVAGFVLTFWGKRGTGRVDKTEWINHENKRISTTTWSRKTRSVDEKSSVMSNMNAVCQQWFKLRLYKNNDRRVEKNIALKWKYYKRAWWSEFNDVKHDEQYSQCMTKKKKQLLHNEIDNNNRCYVDSK